MRRVAWRVAGAAALCAAAVAAEEEDGSGSGSGSADAHRVLTLEDDTFEAAIQAEVLLVEFYAPWCGHCKEIAPAYDLAAQQLGKIHGKQLLAKIDATNSASAVVKYKVHSYPTILLFSEGENVDELSGARSATDITAYMSKFARGPEEMIALKESIARTKAAEAGTGHLVLATPDMYNDFLLDHAEGTVVTFFHAKFCQVRPCPCRNRLFNRLISHGLRDAAAGVPGGDARVLSGCGRARGARLPFADHGHDGHGGGRLALPGPGALRPPLRRLPFVRRLPVHHGDRHRRGGRVEGCALAQGPGAVEGRVCIDAEGAPADARCEGRPEAFAPGLGGTLALREILLQRLASVICSKG